MPLILGTNSIKDTGYEVANSVRLNQGDHAHFSKTPSTSNGTTFTYSFWVKRARVDVNSFMLRMVASDNSEVDLLFEPSGNIRIQEYEGVSGTNKWKYVTNRLFRDPSAWYHVMYVVDTNNGTASDRVQLYINGVRETSFSTATNPSSGATSALSKGEARGIGGQVGGSSNSFDGYMAEVVYVDGTAKSTTDFGEFDDSGIWKPIDVSSMSLGSNGWYLDFEDSSSLGNDASGSNNWTSNNLTSIDQTTDTCTNNFATMNPLANQGTVTFSDGNLSTNQSNNSANVQGTIFVNSGKWYWECKSTDANTNLAFGIMRDDTRYTQSDIYQAVGTIMWYKGNGQLFDNIPTSTGGISSAYGNTWGDGDIVSCAMDLDNGYLYFAKNGTYQNSGVPTSGATGTGGISIPTGEFFTAVLGNGSGSTSASSSMNFGSPPFSISSGNADGEGFGNFEYAVPSGYFALCTKNLAEYG